MSRFKNRKFFPVLWGLLSLVVLVCDFLMGPYIQFPFLFIIPVTLAAWYSGPVWGFLLATILPLVRLYFALLWPVPWTMLDSSINALIRVIVLLLLAFLVDRVAAQT
jgi:predicted membrane protein